MRLPLDSQNFVSSGFHSEIQVLFVFLIDEPRLRRMRPFGQ
jgi:hypothetical protein